MLALLLNEEIRVYENATVFYNLLFQSQNELANTILKAMLTLSMLLVHRQARKCNKASLASASAHSSAKRKSTQAIETKRCIQASEHRAECCWPWGQGECRVCIYLYSGCCCGIPSPSEKWQHQLGKRYHLDGTKCKQWVYSNGCCKMHVTTDLRTRRMSESRKRLLIIAFVSVKSDLIFLCCVRGNIWHLFLRCRWVPGARPHLARIAPGCVQDSPIHLSSQQ